MRFFPLIEKDGIQVEKSKTKWLCVYVRHKLYCKKFHRVVMKRCIAYEHLGLLRGIGREKTKKRKQTGRDDDAVISCSSETTKESVRPRPLVSGDFPSPFSKKKGALRSLFESISPVHTKTLKHGNAVASLTGDALYDV